MCWLLLISLLLLLLLFSLVLPRPLAPPHAPHCPFSAKSPQRWGWPLLELLAPKTPSGSNGFLKTGLTLFICLRKPSVLTLGLQQQRSGRRQPLLIRFSPHSCYKADTYSPLFLCSGEIPTTVSSSSAPRQVVGLMGQTLVQSAPPVW